jgi:hypothetical protein
MGEIEASVPSLEELATPEGRERGMAVIVQSEAAVKSVQEECARLRAEAAYKETESKALEEREARLRGEFYTSVDRWKKEKRSADYWHSVATGLGNMVKDIQDHVDLARAVEYTRDYIFLPDPEKAEASESAGPGPSAF